MAPPALRSSCFTSRTRLADLLIPAAAALGALYLTLRHRPFPAPGDVPILDLIAFEDPLAYTVIRVWYYLAPACVTFALGCVVVRYATLLRRAAGRAGARVVDHLASAAETANRLLSWRLVTAFLLAVLALAWSVATRPFPAPGDVPLLNLIALEDPAFYTVIRTWYLIVPSVYAFIGVMVLTSAYRLWFGSRGRDRRFGRGTLPRWPTSPDDEAPSLSPIQGATDDALPLITPEAHTPRYGPAGEDRRG